jgi:shikimate dehydrogenase
MISSNTSLYCVIGNPIKHSKSPLIHNYIFRKLNIDAVYLAFEIKDLKAFFTFVRDTNVKGISITIPHKVESIKYIDEVEPIIEKINAINTVKNKNGKLIGYNTDIVGVIKAFETNSTKSLKGKTSLILGSGGVARAVIWALVEMGTESITIAGRTPEKLEELKNEVIPHFKNIEAISLSKVREIIKNTDVIANCTPIGMTPNTEESPIDTNLINENHIVFDTVYTPKETKLIKDSKQVGAKTILGIDMFIFQALEQDKIWLETEEVFVYKGDIENILQGA